MGEVYLLIHDHFKFCINRWRCLWCLASTRVYTQASCASVFHSSVTSIIYSVTDSARGQGHIVAASMRSGKLTAQIIRWGRWAWPINCSPCNTSTSKGKNPDFPHFPWSNIWYIYGLLATYKRRWLSFSPHAAIFSSSELTQHCSLICQQPEVFIIELFHIWGPSCVENIS